jgi:hypothetical protein
MVDYNIGVSYWPGRLHRLGMPVRQPYDIVDYIPQSGTKNVASVLLTLREEEQVPIEG